MTRTLSRRRLFSAGPVISAVLTLVGGAGLVGASTMVSSPLTITPTFDTTITSDPNAAAIELTINSAIDFYTSHITTETASSINVKIEFQEMNTGLGQSNSSLDTETYHSFMLALTAASSGDATDIAALAHLGATNPVTGSTFVEAKSALLRALGYTGVTPTFDGVIGLNTSITNPGSPGSSLSFSLMSTAEHEIDEVLGLGSNLTQTFSNNPAPEDLFRYASNGTRSYTTNASTLAYFSVDGTTDLAQFDNQNDGGDWGDWQSNPLPAATPAQVQDAFANGSNPILMTNSVELVALDAIGYNMAQVTAPEPGTTTMFGAGLTVLAGMIRRRRYQK